MKKLQNIKINDTFWLILLGSLAFGGSKGRFFLGLSLFDFLLVFLYIKSFKRLTINWVSIYFFSIALYGLLVGQINHIFIDNTYSNLVMELRFYLYIPVYYQIIKNLNFDIKNLNNSLTFLLVLYIILYLFFLNNNSFLFYLFNSERSEKAFDFMGRISGPPTIFISMLFFVTLNTATKYRNVFLYFLLIAVVYIKTGERTVLLTNLLPLFWFVYQKRSVWMLAALPFAASFIPLYVNKIQIKRFYDILDPMNDPAFRYRVNNIRMMLFEKMPEYPHTFFTGFGIGSDYNIKLSGWNSNHSYFLDNSYVMLLYKMGIFVAVFFLILIYSRVKGLKLFQQLYLITFISIPSLLSYHLLLQPAYLFSYFLVIKILTKKHENNSLLS